VNLTPDADPDFRPHGLSLWVAPDGNDRLFVINHQGGRHTIEEFEVRAERLAHVRTLADPLLRSPNDLVAVGPDRLYVTNDHRWPRGVARTLEEWLRLPASDVIAWDGRGFGVAATGIRLSNGINASRDGSTVFVASPTGRELLVYDRDAASGALRLRERIDLGTAPDNVEVADDGSLWVGAHPKLLALVAHGNGAPEHSPSQVVRASPRAGGGYAVEEVLLDTGERQCGSSVAAVRGDRLLVGGIFEDHVLDCTR
jgi:arylesterase/paraoxonase